MHAHTMLGKPLFQCKACTATLCVALVSVQSAPRGQRRLSARHQHAPRASTCQAPPVPAVAGALPPLETGPPRPPAAHVCVATYGWCCEDQTVPRDATRPAFNLVCVSVPILRHRLAYVITSWYALQPCFCCLLALHSLSPASAQPTNPDAHSDCQPGFGGPNCMSCVIGAWSAGGRASDTATACVPCAPGFTTPNTRSTFAAACSRGSRLPRLACVPHSRITARCIDQ